MGTSSVRIERLEVSACRIPTDAPEQDGTLSWQETTIVLVRVQAGGRWGLGYGYADQATAGFIQEVLAKVLLGQDAMAVAGCWQAMRTAIRNHGRPGVASMAMAAVDTALWDLKARLLNLPLAVLLGAVRDSIGIYGSGGFTSYPLARLQAQLGGWADMGLEMVKMKVGAHPAQDPQRVAAAREAVGDQVELFVDANGAYERKQALAFAERVAAGQRVTWFEEPVSSDDLAGLRLLRDRAPAGMQIAAGEYGYDLPYFRRMLEAQAVDVLMADATRCGGITGFVQVGVLCSAFGIPLSAHCAPALHLHAACALASVCHIEYFHDHVRIEQMLFEGTIQPENGRLRPDLSRPGMGLELKENEVQRYLV